MTLQELYSVYYIKQEIEDFEKKIDELREIAEKITPSLTGMPRGGGVGDKVGENATAIAMYETLLQDAIIRRTEQEKKIFEYILKIDDAQLRRIMYLRFIELKTWQQIANKIGGHNTADGVRKRCNRYVRKIKKLSVLSAQNVV